MGIKDIKINDKIAIQDTYGDRFRHCRGCGSDNDQGIKLKSYPSLDKKYCMVKYTPSNEFTGGVPHNLFGGIIAMIFDCHGTASAAFFKHNDLGKVLDERTIIGRFITARLEIDFKAPAPMGSELTVVSKASEIGERKVIVDMDMYADDKLRAQARIIAVSVKDNM
ncbi:MAG: acyl-CoA thioesterase [Tissierellia bacterium]|nr:acyl-CoA thioesterase [Tissierellia bacterium]